jgi:sporulation related protein
MSSTAARARSSALVDRQAKDRRQMIMVGVLGVLLLAVLAFQLPKLLKSSGSSSPAPATVAPTTPAAASPTEPSAALQAAMKQAPRDVFQRPAMTIESTLGSVAPPPGLHDPFASPRSVGAVSAPAAPPAPAQTTSLPGTIVLGTPGAGKVAVQGWIVILASIPTSNGQRSADAFAAKARNAGLTSVAILNSSTRQGLRGGYWAVYTGPYDNLTQVSTAATNVHAAGFGSAYIRELLVYKAKTGTTTTKKKR